MIIAKIHIRGTEARTICCETITKGIVGAKVALEYDEELWAGLTKKVVFTNGLRTVELVDPGDLVDLPPEVVDTVGKNVNVGVCGTDAGGKLVIPTLWTVLSWVRNAVPVEADEAADPTPPVWAQLLAMIGNTKELKTDAKESLVAAVNELVARGGEIDAAEVQRIVEEYLAANMPEVELPDTLPNPHPLHFTGAVEASYDGSEEVTVEIPQGGGSAGEWEVLCEHELVEAATISLTFDATKDEYLCLILVPKTETALSSGGSSFLGANSAIYYVTISSTAYATMTVLYSQMIGEGLQRQLHATAHGPTTFNPNTTAARNTAAMGVYKANRSDGLKIGNPLPAGSKVRIYGR